MSVGEAVSNIDNSCEKWLSKLAQLEKSKCLKDTGTVPRYGITLHSLDGNPSGPTQQQQKTECPL